jgi:hypothetical protein
MTILKLEGYLPIIAQALNLIGSNTAKLSESWTKFLLYGVPSDPSLEDCSIIDIECCFYSYLFISSSA